MNQIINEKKYLNKLINCSPLKLSRLVRKSTYNQIHTIIQCVLHCNNLKDSSIASKSQNNISNQIRKIKNLSKAKAFIIDNKDTIIPLVITVVLKVFEKVLFS
jgi:hypothetical protein